MQIIPQTELILNPDGSVYHIKLKSEHIADDVIIVGDQGRVSEVSKYFDKIEFKISNREFITHTGTYKGKRITVISTGIGTDNIDIVINELDAAVNIDPGTRTVNENKRKLNILRIGTSGALHDNIPVDSFVISEYGLGLDGLLNFYSGLKKIDEAEISKAFRSHCTWPASLPYPYVVKGSVDLLKKFEHNCIKGITATAPGFYGPQGRVLRLNPFMPDLNSLLSSFKYNDKRITNFEMETSALFGLSKLLGHDACTICVIIANRVIKAYSKNHKAAVNSLIIHVLEGLTP